MQPTIRKTKLEYLYRDDGNYKLYGFKIFTNKSNLSLEEIETRIRKRLIDTEFFYPKQIGLPLLHNSHSMSFFDDWYEFERVTNTDEMEPTMIDIMDFIHQLENAKIPY